METYLLVNIFFLCLIILIFRIRNISRTQVIALGILLVMTALFDSIIVGLGIVRYDSAKILGIYIGLAPIEDFFYIFMAILAVPAIWHTLGKYYDKRS